MTCGMMFFMLSVGVHAQEQDREQVLMEDIVRLVERAVRDNVISEEERIGMEMLPDRLYEPDDYVSPDERRRANEKRAMASAAIDKDKILKHVRPLKMNVHLRSILRFFFGHNVSQRPKRWDQEVVPQMGGVYDIIMPGGRPDDSWRDQPGMVYDPHPDKHFRR